MIVNQISHYSLLQWSNKSKKPCRDTVVIVKNLLQIIVQLISYQCETTLLHCIGFKYSKNIYLSKKICCELENNSKAHLLLLRFSSILFFNLLSMFSTDIFLKAHVDMFRTFWSYYIHRVIIEKIDSLK